MSKAVPAPVTPTGDLNLHDRAGASIYVGYKDSTGATVNISGNNVVFECGSLSITLSADGVGKRLTISKANVETIEEEKSTRFVVLNKTPTTPIPLWEGFVFTRGVD